MAQTALKDYIEPFPGIRDFVFVPLEAGDSRTWIYSADEAPQTILNFHFASLLTHGWRVSQSEPSIVANRGNTNLAVDALSRSDGTRVVYEVTV